MCQFKALKRVCNSLGFVSHFHSINTLTTASIPMLSSCVKVCSAHYQDRSLRGRKGDSLNQLNRHQWCQEGYCKTRVAVSRDGISMAVYTLGSKTLTWRPEGPLCYQSNTSDAGRVWSPGRYRAYEQYIFWIFKFYSPQYNSIYKMLHRQKVFLNLGHSFGIGTEYRVLRGAGGSQRWTNFQFLRADLIWTQAKVT